MSKKLFILTVLFTNWAFASLPGPSIECRFAALTEVSGIGLDEVVGYTLSPDSGVIGDFDPYTFDISVRGATLYIKVFLENETISTIQVPVINVLSQPIGASIFGVNTVYHEQVDEFVSVRYECIKAVL